MYPGNPATAVEPSRTRSRSNTEPYTAPHTASWAEGLAALRARQQRTANTALAAVGLVGGVALGLTFQAIWPLGSTLADLLWAASVLAAVVGTYGVLILLVLIARLPVLERAIGQDRLVVAHKRIAPWALSLVAAHVVLVVASYARTAVVSWWSELWSLNTTTPWILPATAGLAALVLAGLTSWRHARSRMRHETWWTIHLYTYLGIALAFAHQITAGGPFMTGWARALWVALYVATFGSILWFRVLVPLRRSWRHDLRVAAVVRETPDMVSVLVSGRNLRALGVQPGQFFNWRFLHPGLRYEAHPYSLSGLPRQGMMRLTVKALGDASTALADVPVGTRVLVEGPYGATTPVRVRGSRVVLVAAGAGIAPIRTLVDTLGAHLPMDVIYRASNPQDLALAQELRGLARPNRVRVHLMAGSRTTYPLTADHLYSLVGPLSDADVFVCGPESLNQLVERSARELGADPDRIHHEEFNL